MSSSVVVGSLRSSIVCAKRQRGAHWAGAKPRAAHLVCQRWHSAPSTAACKAVKHEDQVKATQALSPVGKVVNWVSTVAAKWLGVVAIVVALILVTPTAAEAGRSGGRMGGSGFRGARSSGMTAMGRSSGIGAGSFGSPSASRSRMSAPRPVVAPSFGFGLGLSPFGYGVPMYSSGGSLFTVLLLGIFAYIMFNTITGGMGGAEEEEDDVGAGPMSVVKMQVGLLGSARGIQRELNRMGNNLDTSTPQGLHYLLTETVLALRRNPQYAVYGKAELRKTRGLDNAEAAFNQVSMDERGKFERETLSNYGGRTTRSVANVKGDGINELIMVTIIAAVDGKVEPTDITDQESLRSNLALLGSVPADRLLALEVLWTPQDETDYYTRDELVTDYPAINML